MEQKQRENEEYIARKNAEITELEEEHEELKARLQELKLKAEEIADMKKMIISNQKSAEETIAALGEQMQTVVARMDSFQTSIEGILQIQTGMEQTVETLERTLMNKLEEKEDRKPMILVLGEGESNNMHLFFLNRDRTQWSTLSLDLPTSLNCGGAVYLDGEIYIFGGRNSEKKTYKLSREMKWIQLAEMNEERRSISNSSVVFDGCIWVFGGCNNSENYLNSVEKYKPEANEWIQMPSMREKRADAAAAPCKGKLFVCGGHENLRLLISMECFDPASEKWTMFLDLPSPTWGHAMISDGICLTVLGGDGEEKSVWKINPNEEKATWKKLPQMKESRYDFTANLLGDNIFAIGGDGNERKVEFFNGEVWEEGPELPVEIHSMHSMVIPAHLAAALSSQQ